MSDIHQGISITTVDATQTFPLGLEIEDPRGGAQKSANRFRYVKAGSAISAGNALVVSLADADEPNTLVPSSAANQVVTAIAEVAIASASFGWVQVRGRHAGVLKASGAAAAVAAGQALTTSGTAGALIPVAGDGDSNVTSTKLNAVIAMAAGIGVQALDSTDSNSALVEVIIT